MKPSQAEIDAADKDRAMKATKQKRLRMPPWCEECGSDRSENPPSKLCPGCQAYRDHQR